MPSTKSASRTEGLAAVVQRLAFDAPKLTDLGADELEQLAKLVVAANLRDDLRRLAALAKIDCEAEIGVFLKHASRSGSEATLRAYTRSLDRLKLWLHQKGGSILTLTPQRADDYIYDLRLTGGAPGTIRLDVAGASAFFSFLERRHEAVRNPFRGSRARPVYSAVRELAVPDARELGTILETARPMVRAAIVCMSQRGLRVGALPTLILHGDQFHGRSKGKTIQGTMPESALASFSEAGLDRRRPFRAWGARLIADRVRRHASRLAGSGLVDAVYSAHDYRHYFAVKEYRENPDIYRLKKLLGHYDIRTTERYLKTLRIL